MNEDFQRTARRDKKAFLNEQCKEVEESNMKGNTIFLQENWRYQGSIPYKDGHNKGQNGKDLTVAEEIKKRWQKYTDITKVLMTQIIMMVWPLT